MHDDWKILSEEIICAHYYCLVSRTRALPLVARGRLGQRLLKGEELIRDAIALVDRPLHNVDDAIAREAALAVELVPARAAYEK